VTGAKSTKKRQGAKGSKEALVKKAFFLTPSQFRSLKIYAATNDLGISDALRQLLAKSGIK
jgi:hypothetical protein